MNKAIVSCCVSTILLLAVAPAAGAQDFDPFLAERAVAYQEWVETWHTGDMGGLTASVRFTDEGREEIQCVLHQGDSMIWTGMYLGSQALRYRATRDGAALSEVLRIVGYLHFAMGITDTLGYLPRYAGHDVHPWNCGYGDGHGWKVHGAGEWEGCYWVDHTSRDQYSGWMWGMALAYEALDGDSPEEIAARAAIRQDMRDVIRMLAENEWHITDQNGEWTGNNAHWIGPMKRLAWLVTAASVVDEAYYWYLLDQQYAECRPFLVADISAFYNRYDEYYGNNLRHLDFQAVFRLWPDRERLEDLYDLWLRHNRRWVANTHNAWFDAVHVTGCRRLDACDPGETAAIAEDIRHGLSVFWEPPNVQRRVACRELPLDPFSVWMDEFLRNHPEMEGIIDISPQTAEAHEVDDRCWTDMLWQSPPFHISCGGVDDPTFVGSGFDYLVAYWMGVYYGLLPGGGPYGDDDLTGDDWADDDFTEDDDLPEPDDDDGSFGDGGDAPPSYHDDGGDGCS